MVRRQVKTILDPYLTTSCQYLSTWSGPQVGQDACLDAWGKKGKLPRGLEPQISLKGGEQAGWLGRFQDSFRDPHLLFLLLRLGPPHQKKKKKKIAHSPLPPHPLSGDTEQKQAPLISQGIKETTL